MTYDKLLAQYLKTVPNAEVQSPAGQDAFNQWAGQLASQYGGNSFESIPDNAFGNPFVGDTLQQTINDTLLSGAQKAGQGGNTNQVQGGFQQGNFNTAGQSNQTGKTVNDIVSNQATTSTNTGTSGLAGTNVTQGTTKTNIDQSTTGTATRNVNDTLGFGRLLQSQAPGAVAADAKRTAFLGDLVDTGGKQFQDQVNYAANRALSGPGMTGVGNGAKGRVAGSAVEGVARNNLDARLAASGQLAGPTAVTQLASAGNPYLGDTTSSTAKTTGTNTAVTDSTSNFNQTGTQSNTGLTNTAGSQSSLGLSNLLTNETNSGSSAANSAQIATGQIPESKTTSSGGGGCMVCSAYADMGEMHPGAIRRGVSYKLTNLQTYRKNVEGYMLYGPWIVHAIRKSGTFARVFRPVARGILYEECRLASPKRHAFRIAPFVAHKAFVWVSALAYVAGRVVGHSGRVEDRAVENILKRNNLFFTWR